MLKKILVVIAFAFSSYCLANNDCEIKPVLKEFPESSTLNQIENKLNNDITIKIPIPQSISVMTRVFIYDKDKPRVIIFSKDKDNSFKELNEKAFGIKKIDKNDKEALNYKKGLISCDDKIIEIKLHKDNYRAFILLSKNPDNTELYNMFIIPSNQRDNYVYMITINKFDKAEAEKIIGTLHIKGN